MFWPLVSRLFALAVLSLVVALAYPTLRKANGLQGNGGYALSAALAVAIVVGFWGMFQPHASIAPTGDGPGLTQVDPTQSWQMLVDGDYDVSVMYWTNDILDPDQKTTFVLGHDTNQNYMTRYKNDKVKDLVAAARIEADPVKREQMYVELQKLAKQDVNWIDLYYSPYINISRSNVKNFLQNPLGRFTLEEVVKN